LLGFRASRRSHGLELVDSLSAADVQVRISSTRYGCLHRVPVVSFLTNGAILLALLLAAMGSLSLSLSLSLCVCVCASVCVRVRVFTQHFIYIYIYICMYVYIKCFTVVRTGTSDGMQQRHSARIYTRARAYIHVCS